MIKGVGLVFAGIVIGALFFVLRIGAAPDTVTPSLVLNQSTVRIGDAVTFTATYPQDAARSQHNTSFHDQPNIQINCGLSGSGGFSANGYMATRQKITGGWVSQTYPIVMDGTAGQHCVVALYYFTIENGAAVLHNLAETQFDVQAGESRAGGR